MHLKGWTHPLPDYIADAVKSGILLVVVVTTKLGEAELLYGEVKSPSGFVISFK